MKTSLILAWSVAAIFALIAVWPRLWPLIVHG